MDIFYKNNAKIAFAAIALTLAASSITLSGCGESRSGARTGAAPAAISAQRQSADIKVKFDFPADEALASEVRSLEFTLYDEDLSVCYTRTALRGDIKQGCVTLSGAPLEARFLVCLLRDARQNPVGLFEGPALNLQPGLETVVEAPDYASAAAGLGERLNQLRLTPSAPVKLNAGEKIQLRAEGVFSCKNGAELNCDLTSCSRLVWESSNNSLLRHLGGGRFKALAGGSVKAYASLGSRQAEADLIIKAAASPRKPQNQAEPAAPGGVKPEPAEADTDPAVIAEPEPLAVETPCSLKLDLSRCCLPSELSLEVRGYDVNNQLRFRKAGAGLKETLEADQSVTRLAGVLLEGDGQVYGIFTADIDLRGQKSCTVGNPRILSGAELAARGEMVISSDRAVYDLGGEERVYGENGEEGRCVYVYCSAEVRYSIIPGVWAYSSGGAFLEELCRFKAEASESEEYGVFRFFEAGEYTVSVSYRGVTGVFSVEVIDSSSPVIGDYKINIDLSSCGLPSGAIYEVRGYSRRGTLLFSEANVSELNKTFADVNKNIAKLIGVVSTSEGEPWGMFELAASLRDGEVFQVSSPALLCGEELARQKGALSCRLPAVNYYLENKGADGALPISAFPSLTYAFGNGWTSVYTREDMRAWEAFALTASPYLEYYSSDCRYRLRAYEPGSYTLSASYRGLTAAPLRINVLDTPAPAHSVEINFAASGLPADAALICCQLYKDGEAVSEEICRSKAAKLSLEGVSPEADAVVFKVKNADGRLVGLGCRELSFDEGGRAALNGVTAASGSAMDAYIKSFTASPERSLKTVGEYLTGTARAEFSFDSGRILQSCDVSAEAFWSSSDLAEGVSDSSRRIAHAGESALRVTLGGKSVDLKVYVSGEYDGKTYRYTEADLSGKRAVGLAVYAPDGTSERGVLGGMAAGGSAAEEQSPNFEKAENYRAGELLRQVEADGRAELRIRAAEEQLFAARSGAVFSEGEITGLNKDEAVRTIDYVNARNGDTISGLYDTGLGRYYDAKVILGNEGITLPNGYQTSGQIIVLCEIVDGVPLLDVNNPDDLLKLLAVDYMMGVKNPFDREGKPVLERIRQDIGHECGYGCGGGISGLEKVVISVADLGEYGGIAYATATNCFPKSIYRNSNECEMITFNYFKYQYFDPASMCSNFAHEFSHLVSYNTRCLRDVPNGYKAAKKAYFRRASVLEEGRADLCSFLCGFGPDDRLADFSEFAELIGAEELPEWAVIYNAKAADRRMKTYCYLNQIGSYSIKDSGYYGSEGSSVIANYGQGCFFLAYLYDRFGLDTLNRFAAASPNDSEYQNLPYGASHKDYELLARVVGEEEGRELGFAELYEEYGKTLLLNSAGEADNIPSAYRLTTLMPGRVCDVSLTDEEFKYFGIFPVITPKSMGASFSEDGITPWSLNYYVTPEVIGSVGPYSSIFGLWGSLTSRFKLMLFEGGAYAGDIE